MANLIDPPQNEIIHGDKVEILSTYNTESVDLAITLPEYCREVDFSNYEEDFKNLGSQIFRVLKKGGVLIWLVSDYRTEMGLIANPLQQALFFKDEIGFFLHDTMIIDTTKFPELLLDRYPLGTIYAFIFSKKVPKVFNPKKDRENESYKKNYTFSKKRRKRDGSMSHPSDKSRIEVNQYGMRFNLWDEWTNMNLITEDEFVLKHPRIFPEGLIEDLLSTWSNAGELVFDPMIGPGTTMKMAKKLKRKYIGIDSSEENCKMTKKRLKNVPTNSN